MPNLDWMKEIDLEEVLEGDARRIYERCGPDVLIALLGIFEGMFFYLPAKITRKARQLYILKNYNGRNANDLAIRLGTSSRYVYKIVSQNKQLTRKAIRPTPISPVKVEKRKKS